MRLDRIPPIIAFCLLAALLAACGGSSGSGALDVSKIATATLPAQLPEPRILSNSAVSSAGGSSYVIQDGDTLGAIASRLGVTLEDLEAANPGLDPGALRVGQSIKLPAASDAAPAQPAPTQAADTSTPEPQATEPPPPVDTPVPADTATPSSVGQTYTVQDGDYPGTIAQKFGITVEALLAANPGIDPTNLHIGDVLIIPPQTTSQ